jgi:hypothetical protein
MNIELLFAGIKVIVAIGALIALLFTFYLTGKFTYHVYKLVSNCTGRYAFLFGPLLWFMPSQFNLEGNDHRIRLIRMLPKLMASFTITFCLNYLSIIL